MLYCTLNIINLNNILTKCIFESRTNTIPKIDYVFISTESRIGICQEGVTEIDFI